ncbi:MAG: hypothetical protein NTW14_11785 [bacterium]|nr:hypothetical protein [bacterium]
MTHTTGIVSATLLIFVINLPFGYWRAGVRKFSRSWFLAVHIPVPLAVGTRLLMGIGLQFHHLPFFVAAFFSGQFLGGKMRKKKQLKDSE